MEYAQYRIEVFYRHRDPRAGAMQRHLTNLGYHIRDLWMADNYLIYADLTEEESRDVAASLVQPVTQGFHINKACDPGDFTHAIEVGFLPGVTDNVAHTVSETMEDLLGRPFPSDAVFSSTTWFVAIDEENTITQLARELHNPLIHRAIIKSAWEYRSQGGMGRELPLVTLHERADVDEVNLDCREEDLVKLGREGIADPDGTRRGPLALDLSSMIVIKDYFKEKEKRNPTDIELESIAQTWSEHCKHTIFAAKMDDDVDAGIFSRYIKEATVRIRREKGDNDFCMSVFSDNAGGIEFDENYIIADKVETHNSPSALDPFGGAITGIVGVNRDAIGFGMASKPVANRYGYCFASPFDDRPLYRSKDEESRMLPPRRIMEGVIHGVNVGGNTSGIPTPQGFVYFDERYRGKPLVFVGTVGLLPKKVKNLSAVKKKAMNGDYVVMAGGRVGRDGIHGATFSSEALSSGSPATAVQIGDPITQKKMSDAIVKEARDLYLYNSITDNGAGGLSCSVSEMARESGGFEVDLDAVPLKYPGLSPWQIWVSESQERMTLAVPPEKIDDFMALMKKRGVEATVIGRFTDGTRGVVRYQGKKVFDMDMTFLHDGLPQKEFRTTYTKKRHPEPVFEDQIDLSDALVAMNGRLNTASFEFISSQYDHEVQGNSVIKPVQGPGRVNGNASVIRPLLDSRKGVVLSQGIYPSYSDIDTYWMAAASIDTAIRNAIAAGGTLERMALLDNFCWCDSNNPERLGQLKEAARACYEMAVAYGTPYVSGKDSMFNDFRGYDENFNEVEISIPPTLLISSIGVVEDIDYCQTLDFKNEGDAIYILGITRDEMGGSEYYAWRGEEKEKAPYVGNSVPKVDPGAFTIWYRAFEEAMRTGLIASSLSVERGGLGVALARSAMAGKRGALVNLANLPAEEVTRNDTALFSESQGRILFSVSPDNMAEVESLFGGMPLAKIGEVTGITDLHVMGLQGAPVATVSLEALTKQYRDLFRNF